MDKISLNDEGMSFDALLLRPSNPSCVVLFATGSGGNPERHLQLLTFLADHKCTVIAPYFERLMTPYPSAADLLTRARRLSIALASVSTKDGTPNLTTVGIGHSIGATLLLALAGGQMWMRAGAPLVIARAEVLQKLVLFAAPTGFFQAPSALYAISVPLQIWAGTLDTFAPPTQADFLRQNLPANVPVDLHVVDGAGHFSFMNTLPPHITDLMPDRDVFLHSLATDIVGFMMG